MKSPRFTSIIASLILAAGLCAMGSQASPAASANVASTPSYKVGYKLHPKAAAKSSGVRQIEWDDLMPADWDPMKGIQTLKLAALGDGDPQATAALQQLKKAWGEAPVVPATDRQHVVIAGFAVPLDAEGTTVHEMLLVPYFGACIHTATSSQSGHPRDPRQGCQRREIDEDRVDYRIAARVER